MRRSYGTLGKVALVGALISLVLVGALGYNLAGLYRNAVEQRLLEGMQRENAALKDRIKLSKSKLASIKSADKAQLLEALQKEQRSLATSNENLRALVDDLKDSVFDCKDDLARAVDERRKREDPRALIDTKMFNVELLRESLGEINATKLIYRDQLRVRIRALRLANAEMRQIIAEARAAGEARDIEAADKGVDEASLTEGQLRSQVVDGQSQGDKARTLSLLLELKGHLARLSGSKANATLAQYKAAHEKEDPELAPHRTTQQTKDFIEKTKAEKAAAEKQAAAEAEKAANTVAKVAADARKKAGVPPSPLPQKVDAGKDARGDKAAVTPSASPPAQAAGGSSSEPSRTPPMANAGAGAGGQKPGAVAGATNKNSGNNNDKPQLSLDKAVKEVRAREGQGEGKDAAKALVQQKRAAGEPAEQPKKPAADAQKTTPPAGGAKKPAQGQNADAKPVEAKAAPKAARPKQSAPAEKK